MVMQVNNATGYGSDVHKSTMSAACACTLDSVMASLLVRHVSNGVLILERTLERADTTPPRLCVVNPAAVSLLGLYGVPNEPHQPIDRVLAAFHPCYFELMAAILECHVPTTFQFSLHPVERTLSVFVEVPTPTTVIVTFTDVTERQRVQRSQPRLRDFLDRIPDAVTSAIIMLDCAEKICSVNEQAARLFALPCEEIIGCSFDDSRWTIGWPNGERLPSNSRVTARVLRSGLAVREFVCRFTNVRGMQYTLSINAVPVHDSAGTLIGIVVSLTDISALHFAEEALRESEERYALLQQSSNDGAWDWNMISNEVDVSPRWMELMGFPPHEITPQTLDAWAGLVHPEDSRRFHEQLEACARQDAMKFEVELRMRHRDGSYRWFVLRGVVLRDSQGVSYRVSGSQGDITDRVTTQQALQAQVGEVWNSLEGAVHALSLTSAWRDPYTAGHQQRVSQLAGAIARKIGLTSHEVRGVEVAGVLHDIGKIAVPIEILCKPGEITAHEREIIKSHAEIGYEILKDIHFSWPVAEVVRQHHMRFDGSGYPDCNSSNDMLLAARILAVADVVEAISSHRPYRPALGVDKALEEINRYAGVRYDREVVQACIAVFQQGFKFYEKSADICKGA